MTVLAMAQPTDLLMQSCGTSKELSRVHQTVYVPESTCAHLSSTTTPLGKLQNVAAPSKFAGGELEAGC